jgi:uncharacterized UPF0160 family protein
MTYYTHAGLFHCDEVAGFAITKVAKICTSFKRLTDIVNLPNDGLISDIGRVYDPSQKRFDHHQAFLVRENGYPMASAGLLWKEFGLLAVKAVLPESKYHTEIAKRVDERLIQGIDAHDADSDYYASAECSAGKVEIITLPILISFFNAHDIKDDLMQKVAFESASDLLVGVLIDRIVLAGKYFDDAERFDSIATIENEIAVLSEGVSWKEIIHDRYPNVKYIIAPSYHPGNPFSLLAVTIEPEKREVKIPIERPPFFENFIHQGKWIAGGSSVDELRSLAQWNLTRLRGDS